MGRLRSTGISISNNQTDPNYPSFRKLPLFDMDKTQSCLTRRLFSATDTDSSFFTCIHRTIAEYLGATWICTQIEQGLPLGRIQSIIGVNGHPASELRGLYAWLATLCSRHAATLIPKDPYGILMYGDPASMLPSHRHILLSSLKVLSNSDPWFRAGDWSTKPLGALAKPDMVDEFRRILRDKTSNFHLRSVVLEAIQNGQPLPQLRDDLIQLLENVTSAHSERSDAIDALLHVSPTGEKDLAAVYRQTLVNDPNTHKLRAKILAKIYTPHFTPDDVFRVFKDTLDTAEDHSVGELWFLAGSLPTNALPDIVDKLHYLLITETSDIFDKTSSS